MTDEERLQMITEQLIIVRDNLFRGMSKSIQKLQARSINEVLGLENFISSPQRTWIGLDQTTKPDIRHQTEAFFAGVQWAETRLKELNT